MVRFYLGNPATFEAYQWLDSLPRTIAAKEHRPAYGSDVDYWSKLSRESIFEGVYDLNAAAPREPVRVEEHASRVDVERAGGSRNREAQSGQPPPPQFTSSSPSRGSCSSGTSTSPIRSRISRAARAMYSESSPSNRFQSPCATGAR